MCRSDGLAGPKLVLRAEFSDQNFPVFCPSLLRPAATGRDQPSHTYAGQHSPALQSWVCREEDELVKWDQ